MSLNDRKLKIVTNLDRAGIEAKLVEMREAAKAANLNELAGMFAVVEGMPRAQIEASVRNALAWLAGKPGHTGIVSLLELVELNLPNLK